MILKSYPRWFKHFKIGAELFYSVTLLEQHLGLNLPRPFLQQHVPSSQSATGTQRTGTTDRSLLGTSTILLELQRFEIRTEDLEGKHDVAPCESIYKPRAAVVLAARERQHVVLNIKYSPAWKGCRKSRCRLTKHNKKNQSLWRGEILNLNAAVTL